MRRTASVPGGEEEPIQVRQGSQLLVQQILVVLVQLEALPPPQKTPVLEHIEGLRMEGPVGSFSGSVRPTGHLYKAVVEAEVVP